MTSLLTNTPSTATALLVMMMMKLTIALIFNNDYLDMKSAKKQNMSCYFT